MIIRYCSKVLGFVALFLVLNMSDSLAQAKGEQIGIIPMPQHVEVGSGFFTFSKKTIVESSDNRVKPVAKYLTGRVADLFSMDLRDKCKGHSNKKNSWINLILDQSLSLGDEAYVLSVEENHVEITGANVKGVFYGVQSLLQLFYHNYQADNKLIQISCCTIKDAPRYAWRGFMLDESRHFFGKAKVKQLLDLMAYHKLNKFHWHLTDAPGWRIEIKKFPKLTKIGGIGCLSDPKAKAQYYTQEEIKEIVDYASQRFIDVIPEIDMPGHATAAVHGYPQFSGGGSAQHPDFTFHPGKEGTYQFLGDILDEVAQLFPAPWIHFGGDEVHFGNQKWSGFPEVIELMKRENLKDLKGVEKYFSLRMAKKINSLGKVTAGWDEIVANELPREKSLVMWWRHDHPEVLKDALSKGYATVLCPRIPCYFDFVQHASHKHGRRWSGFCDLHKVYDYPYLPKDITKEEKKLIRGIQANVWSETIQNDKRLDFMTFPRLTALAEAAWTTNSQKNYESFIVRLKTMMKYYDRENIYYFNPFAPKSTPEPKGFRKK